MTANPTTPIAELVKRLRELEAKATPGPWSCAPAVPKAKRCFYLAGNNDAHNRQVDIGTIQGGYYSCEANAALIVEVINALPQILPALEALSAPPSEGEVEAVARAIYEAAPQRDLRYQSPIHWRDCTTELQREYHNKARAAIAALPRRDEGMREAWDLLEPAIQRVLFDFLNGAPHRDQLVGIGMLHEAFAKAGQLRRAALTPEPR